MHAPLKPAPETPDPDHVTLPPAETISEELGLDQEQYWEILMGFIDDKKEEVAYEDCRKVKFGAGDCIEHWKEVFKRNGGKFKF